MGPHLDAESVAATGLDEDEFTARLLSNTAEAILTVDSDGRIVYANPAIERLVGYAPGELVGEPQTKILPEQLQSAEFEPLQSWHEGSGGVGSEIPLVHADGHTVSAVVSVRRHEVGGETFVTSILRDSSGREERESKLADQKRKIEALHTVATRIGRCKSAEKTYEAVVTAAETILDFDIALVDAEIDGMLVPRAVSTDLSAAEYYEETPVDSEDNLAAEAFRTGQPSVVDDLRTRKASPADTEFRSILTVPIGSYGVFQSASREVGVFDDDDRRLAEILVAHAEARLARIETEQRLRNRTKELERQNERLEEFAAMVSHDLRNPLNVAQRRLDLAQEECDSEHLDVVATAHERMDRLVEDVLALARHEKAVEETGRVSLETTAKRCWQTLETPNATLDATEAPVIRADPDRLQQLLENLFRNSVEHSDDGVTITVEAIPDGFAVADDGPGIPPAEREQVFTSGYTTNEAGTGFGLSIVDRITEAHGWDVAVTESAEGGARFEITGVDTIEED